MGRAGSSCSDSPHGPRCLIAPLSHGPHLERGATHHLIQELLEGGDLQGVKGKGEAGHTTQRECNDAEWAAAMRHGPAVSGAGGTAHARPPAAPAGHWAAWRARRRRAGTTAACPRCGPPPVAGKGMGGGGLVWGQGPLASASAGLCRNRVPHGAGGLDKWCLSCAHTTPAHLLHGVCLDLGGQGALQRLHQAVQGRGDLWGGGGRGEWQREMPGARWGKEARGVRCNCGAARLLSPHNTAAHRTWPGAMAASLDRMGWHSILTS